MRTSEEPRFLQGVLQRADALVEAAFDAEPRPDPILGELSRTHGIAMSLARGHGHLLEDAIAAALRDTGKFDVSQGIRFPLTEAARRVVAANRGDLLSRIRLTFDGEARAVADLDIAAVAHDGSFAVAVDVKRGVGQTSGTRRAALERDMLAVRLLLRSFFRQQGYDVDDVAVAIIDVFGSGGHSSRLTVDRPGIDGFFRAPVLHAVDAVTERLRGGIQRRAPELFTKVGAASHAVDVALRMADFHPAGDVDCDDTPVAPARSPWSETFARRQHAKAKGMSARVTFGTSLSKRP